MFLQEMYYFNKPKTLIKTEAELSKLKEYIKAYNKAVKNKDNKAIKKLDEKIIDSLSNSITYLFEQFNFDANYSKFTITSGQYDGISISYSFYRGIPTDIKYFVTIDPKNQYFKFTDRCAPAIILRVPTRYFLDERMTPAMLMGAILHEIGHTFEFKFRHYFEQNKNFEECLNFLERHNIFRLEKKKLIGISKVISSIFLKNPAYDRSMGRAHKRIESFADQFAAMFGYSVELSKLLDIIERDNLSYYDKYTKQPDEVSSIARAIGALGDMLKKFNAFDFESHPDYGERVHNLISFLENELEHNKKMTLKQKRELMNQITDLKKLAMNLNKETDKDSYKTHKYKIQSKKNYEKDYSKSDIETLGIDLLLDG